MTDEQLGELTPEQRKLIDRVSAGALALPAAKRAAYVRESSEGDERVIREVLSLLDGVSESDLSGFLSEAAQVPSDLTTRMKDESAKLHDSVASNLIPLPSNVDRYRLLELIGEGGFGSVYKAEQVEPVRRVVALKLIKPGMDTRQVIARFESERQALALMDHPNVARVLDAGATEAGRPYFVMELVPGIPIHQFCDREKLGLRQRLQLFNQVCEAVQHAHQKGIIHRDIKPSNVIVSMQGGQPIPKVIDFGIAKATDQRLTDQTMFTEKGYFIGTPAYMSPEQADTTSSDIDTRSDIYSLGVLLYELLTGMSPFDQKRLRSAAYHEIQRIIREEDPPKPSTRLSTVRDDVKAIASCRQVNPQQLVKSVRGDLDWIIMKAMEKDRTRRYETASEFARDIERYLTDEPVSASPPSAAYRLRKMFRRNRGAFASVAVIAVTLVLGIAGTTVGMVMARNERDRANESAATAKQEARTAERISEFLVGLFEASDPSEAQGKSISAQELLDIGAAKIQALDDEPEIKVKLQETIGWVYMVLGRIKEARQLLDGALDYREANKDGNEAALSNCLHVLANLHDLAGDYKQAEPLAQRAVDIRERIFGDSREVAQSLNTLGNVLWHEGRMDEAAVVHQRALDMREKLLPPDHPDIAQSLHNLGALRYFSNDLPEAERMYKQAIDIETSAGGEGNHRLATSMHVLAIVYQDQEKYTEAIDLEERSLAMKKKVLGEEHPYVALGLTTLGNVYRLSDRPDLAEPEIRKAVSIAEAAWGKEYGEVWWMRRSLAKSLRDLDRADDAIAELEDLIKTIEGADRLDSLPPNLNLLADLHREAGRLQVAEALHERAMEIDAKQIEQGDAQSMDSLVGFSRVLSDQGRLEEAEKSLRTALSAMESEWGTEDREVILARDDLTRLLLIRGKDEEARTLASDLLKLHRTKAESSSARAHQLNKAAMAYLKCPVAELRDSDVALRFASQAVNNTDRTHPVYLATLADAMNKTGDIEKSIAVQTEALNLLNADDPRRERFERPLHHSAESNRTPSASSPDAAPK